MAFVPLSETKRNQMGSPDPVTIRNYKITWKKDKHLDDVYHVILNGKLMNLTVQRFEESKTKWSTVTSTHKIEEFKDKTIEDIIKMGEIDTYKFNRSGNISKPAYLLAFCFLFSHISIYFLQL